MKFFDLELGGLGAKQARYPTKDWLGRCTMGNYAGGTIQDECEKSAEKLNGADSFYREFLHGCSPANQDGWIFNVRSACS